MFAAGTDSQSVYDVPGALLGALPFSYFSFFYRHCAYARGAAAVPFLI